MAPVGGPFRRTRGLNTETSQQPSGLSKYGLLSRTCQFLRQHRHDTRVPGEHRPALLTLGMFAVTAEPEHRHLVVGIDRLGEPCNRDQKVP